MKFLFICVLVTLTTQEDLLLKVVGLIRHGHRTPIEVMKYVIYIVFHCLRLVWLFCWRIDRKGYQLRN